MNYTEAVDYIENIPKFTKKNKPENTLEMVRRLGHPERAWKIIHVAGTNGKGSVCAFLASILQDAGSKVGLFTSPHLVELTERFQINGVQVSQEDFTEAFVRVKQVVDEMMADGYAHPAYFELLFGVSLLIFRKAGIEYLVLETGLGGRLDATNLVEHPIATVITSISMDHMEYLGDTIGQIASEKAGIIKEGVPVIYDGRVPEVEQVVLAQAERMHAPAYPYYSSMTEILDKTDKSIDFVLNYSYDDKEKTAGRTGSMQITVPYLAEYQLVNSSLAAITAHVIDPEGKLTDEAIAAGIAETRWQGRMETVLPGVVLDGAHNADGIREFIRTVQSVEKRREVSLLFSAVADKEYDTMIRTICEAAHFSHVTVTQIDGSRIVPAQQLAEVFRKYTSAPVEACPDIRQAFETALAARGEGMLFCAGSLYLVGELKAILRNETRQ